MLTQNSSQKNAYQQLHADYLASVSQNEALKLKVDTLEQEVARLKEQVQLLQLRRFGKKSEKQEKDKLEPLQTVSGYTRKKNTKSCGRSLDTSKLPRHVIIHDLAEAEKCCQDCQKPLTLIGQDKAEQVEVLPMRLYVAEHICYKYACRPCEKIKMAPKEKSALPKAIAGDSLLTEIIVNKYQYHLPLYRQSKLLLSFGANIPDNTLGNWVMQLGSALEKVYDALIKAVLESYYLQVDETPIKLLKPNKNGYLWSYYACQLRLIFFELSLTRSGTVAEERLAPYQGLLQTDGYQGYQKLREREGIIGLGCLTHARRKFSEVVKVAKNNEGVAAEALARLNPLYALEDWMSRTNMTPHSRKRLRQKVAWPILKDFHRWLKQTRPTVLPQSQLGKAINYTLKQWRYLILYTRHGIAEIDTNWVENQIRPIAVGRRNWLFMGDEDCGKNHAIFYSLVLSCLINDLNPRLYLHYLISKVHEIRRGELDPSLLLPHNIDKVSLNIFAKNYLEASKKILDASD